MKNGSRLRKGQDPEAEGGKRRRLPYLALAILILLALSCVVMGTVGILGQAPLGLPWAGEAEEGEPGEGAHGPLGLRVQGEAIHALNMAPGDRVRSQFTLENFSREPIRVAVTAQVVSDNGLCQSLLISLLLARQDSSEGSDIIYYGPLTELYRKPDRGLPLSAEGSERLIWSVYFPFESGNEYQAIQCQVDFLFESQQM